MRHYLQLTGEQEVLLTQLEQHPKSYRPHDLLCSRGERTDRLWIVTSGWLYGLSSLPDGGRHISCIYLPGDIVGLSALTAPHHNFDVATITDADVCSFPRRALADIFSHAPLLAALLFAQASAEEAIWIDKLRAASRMKPAARLAYFFLDLINRLRRVGLAGDDRLRLPLTQYVMGDALGLTNVTVCRALNSMEQDGLIRREQGDITLLDPIGLRELCDYVDRYAVIDLSWLPQS